MIFLIQILLRAEHEIIYLKGEGNYSWVYLKNGKKHLTSYTLSWWGMRLKGSGWYRIHKSYLVNLDYIDGKVWDTKTSAVKLSLQLGETKLPVSRRRVSSLIETLTAATQSVSLNP